jgi:tripartite-type tricarboxylate transporter receptor subunit TctC
LIRVLRITVAASLAFAALATGVHAQMPAAPAASFPTKTVRLVVGLPPGSGSDLLARSMAQRLTMAWGQSVVVDNRPGANTIVGTEMVARAAPDGHTLLFGIDIGFTVNPHLYAKLPYDPVKDFAPITLVTTFAVALVASPSLPANNVRELIALAKSQPGKIAYASIGSGSQMHLLSEMLNNKAGIQLMHVPYKGIPQVMTSVLSGETQLTWVGVFSTKPLVTAGRLKALAYSGSKRTPMMPDLPTFAELGYPDVEMSVWYGLLAPAATPRAIVDRIHADVLKLLADPEFREKEMLAKAYEPSGLGPDEFAALIKRELAARAAMVKVSGAKAD